MQLLGFSASQVHPLATLDQAREFLAGNAAARFVWADFSSEELLARGAAAWRDSLVGLTGAPILDLHLQDATNPAHPSYFDTTNAYDMVIFRKLTFETTQQVAEAAAAAVAAAAADGDGAPGANGNGGAAATPATPAAMPATTAAGATVTSFAGPSDAASAAASGTASGTAAAAAPKVVRRYPAGFLPALARIDTQPVTFFVFDSVLLTISPGPSRTIEQVRQRLVDMCRLPRTQMPAPGAGGGQLMIHGVRPPTRPEDLMLRLLNAMVDRYLELRAPLTRQLDRWQRALLSTRRNFSSWEGLLDARIELRRLENLSEEQRDALQEFRDSVLDNRYSADATAAAAEASRDEVLLVRINDLMEHIQRVLAHSRRLEDSIESAVQIHFSAVAHRTNLTMRTLTLITAIFMPLTLITGVFGMNFEHMPWLQQPNGFWWSMGLMSAVVVVLAAGWGISRRLSR